MVQVSNAEFSSFVTHFESFHFRAILHQPKLSIMIIPFDRKENTIKRNFVFMCVEMPSLHWKTDTAVIGWTNDLLSVTTTHHYLLCANYLPLLCPNYCQIAILFLGIAYYFLIVSQVCSLLETKLFESFQASLCVKYTSIDIMYTFYMFW
jgi:hypothetical protein